VTRRKRFLLKPKSKHEKRLPGKGGGGWHGGEKSRSNASKRKKKNLCINKRKRGDLNERGVPKNPLQKKREGIS